MKLKNKILSYFVSPPLKNTQMPRVFLAPVTMNADVAYKLVNEQLKLQKDALPQGSKLLHVCFDLDSERIYIPNAQSFSPDQMKPLLQAAQIRITKDFGGFSNSTPIEGSPFSSLRIRSINSFEYAKNAIEKHFGGTSYKDLPVIEANLARMPTTTKHLPEMYRNNKNNIGGYIGPNITDVVPFIDEIDNNGKTRKNKINLLNQKTPFILIDISPNVETTHTEKEWAVLAGYRDYLYDFNTSKEESNAPEDLNSFASLYAIKRYLYLGWPFEEVCSIFLEEVKSFGELVLAIKNLMFAANSLEAEGYISPAKMPYFLTFKIDINTFPLKLQSLVSDNNGQIDPFKQIDGFHIIEYDKTNSYIIIETPVFISPDNCVRLLKAKNRPFISRYNSSTNTFDVKSSSGVLRDLQNDTEQYAKMKALLVHNVYKNYPDKKENKEKIDFRDDDRAKGISLANPNISNLRKISEYYYAADYIKKMCEDRNMKFVDMPVVIGPLERIFGRGVQGGFMGKKQFIDGKLKIPHEIEKGLWVSPPIMAVNSVSMPSYAEQTETLIHEYSHNLFNITNPTYEHQYNKDPNLQQKDHNKYWYLYLTDPDERLAHKEQIAYQLHSGKSVDEIVRDKVGGAIDENNYAIALKFRELVDEVVDQIENGKGNNYEDTIGTESN